MNGSSTPDFILNLYHHPWSFVLFGLAWETSFPILPQVAANNIWVPKKIA